MSHGARETLRRIGDLIEVCFKMTVQLGEESDLALRGLYNALDNVHQAIDDVDTSHAILNSRERELAVNRKPPVQKPVALKGEDHARP